jgi:MoxR-like ATPase
LKILNERKFKYGQQEVDCPLRICVAASNEWPNDQDGAQELGALFDRFLLRKTVSPVSAAGRKRLLWDRNHQPKFSETITIEELDEARQDAEELEWSDEAVEALNCILDHLNAQGISPGDRRMYKSVLVAQAFAWMQGADEVLPEHLEVLKHCLWVDPHEQPIKTAQIVARIANPTGYVINEKMAQAVDVIAKNTPTEAVPKLQEIQKELVALPHHPRRAAAEKWLQEQIKTQYHKVIGA